MVGCSDGLREDSLRTAVVLLSVWHYDALIPDVFIGEAVLLVNSLCNSQQSSNRRYQSRAEWLLLNRPSELTDGPFAVCPVACIPPPPPPRHHIYFRIQTQNKDHKNSQPIGGLSEKPYSSLTGHPSKKNKLSTNNIIIQ